MRHTAASRMARAGVSITFAQRLLGHSDPRLTEAIYTHLSPEDLESGVENCRRAEASGGEGDWMSDSGACTRTPSARGRALDGGRLYQRKGSKIWCLEYRDAEGSAATSLSATIGGWPRRAARA